jgi:hypothetical protein
MKFEPEKKKVVPSLNLIKETEIESKGKCLFCGKKFKYSVRAQGGGIKQKYCSQKCASLCWYKNNQEKIIQMGQINYEKRIKETKRMSKAVCPFCKKTFKRLNKKRGSKIKRIYCSHTCCAMAWAKRNPEKEKLHRLKEKQKPNYKQIRRERYRKHILKTKYGLTEKDFEIQLRRQNYSCYGCLKTLNKKTARIDHSHKTGEFRGLLCDNCNWALGNVSDNPMTLRRLMAFLDYKRTKLCIYLIGALKNELRIPEIGNILRAEGYDVMDEWITPGRHADENWQRYEKIRGRTYEEALYGRAATNIYLFDRSYIDMCDIAIICMPAGKSAFIEAGYAKGRGKKVFLFLDGRQPPRYDIMPNILDGTISTINDLVKELKKYDKK